MHNISLVPHFGVIGFTQVHQVTRVLHQLRDSSRSPPGTHVPAAGAHAPRPEQLGARSRGVLADVHEAHPHVFSVLRIAGTRGVPEVQLQAVLEHALESCAGHADALLVDFWSSVGAIVGALQKNRSRDATTKRTMTITLRVHRGILERMRLEHDHSFDVRRFMECVLQYRDHNSVHRILFDVGNDVRNAEYLDALRSCYRALRARFSTAELGVCVAGDLGPSSAETLFSVFAGEEASEHVSYAAHGELQSNDAFTHALRFYEDMPRLLGQQSV